MTQRKRCHNHALGASLLALALTTGATASPVDVPEGQAKKAAIEKPAPAISPMARQLKLSGRVEVRVQIEADGSVSKVKELSGNPLLLQPAVAAVKKWKFSPFTEGDKAVEASTTLSFDFKQ